jgi:hypothetical protein
VARADALVAGAHGAVGLGLAALPGLGVAALALAGADAGGVTVLGPAEAVVGSQGLDD